MSQIAIDGGVHPWGEGVFLTEVLPRAVVTVSTPKGPVTMAWEAGTSTFAHREGQVR